MITECTKKNISKILYVINDASLKYKGIIPNDCWHEPYMTKQKLINEFANGVRMFGYNKNNTLVGVMGIQELKDVTLIRHAYILTQYQGLGIGRMLINECIDFAKRKRADEIYLITNDILLPALELYNSSGFELDEDYDDNRYERGNTKMKLLLK